MHRSALEAAAKQAGCTIERDGALFVVRDDWTENEDHAAWLVATKVGVPLESVTVGLGAERSGANGVTPADDGDDFTRSSCTATAGPVGVAPRGAPRCASCALQERVLGQPPLPALVLSEHVGAAGEKRRIHARKQKRPPVILKSGPM